MGLLSTLFKGLSFYWLFRAVQKGPRGLATYAVRKQVRKAVNKRVRKIR